MQLFGEGESGESSDAAEAAVDRRILRAAAEVDQALNSFAGRQARTVVENGDLGPEGVNRNMYRTGARALGGDRVSRVWTYSR